MSVPGFTAEASLQERKGSYSTLLRPNGLRSNSVLPQQGFAHRPFGPFRILPRGYEPLFCFLQALDCWRYDGNWAPCSSPPCYYCCYSAIH